MSTKKVLVIMGSDSDYPVMKSCFQTLSKFGIPYDAKICSAHRSPERAKEMAARARMDGYAVIIGAAGLAAHLPGVLASFTTLPVIGVPCKGGALAGVDALYAIVQMPAGIPVATVAIDGAANAAILATQILAVSDEALADKLADYKRELNDTVDKRDRKLQELLAADREG